MVVTSWINRMFGMDIPHWSCFYLSEFSTVTFKVELNPECTVCSKDL
jgi:hypothetical protein